MKAAQDVNGGERTLPSTGSTPEARQSPGAEALLPAVRKQLEVLEEWVKSELTRQQQQSEVLVERTLRRIEARMQGLDSDQDKLEMNIAQQGGGLKGLTEEFASQALRMDSLETRQWEWRQSVEESLRARLGELERQLKNCATNAYQQCMTNEEAICREAARLRVLEERTGGSDLGSGRMILLEDNAAAMGKELERLQVMFDSFDPGQVAAREEVQWEHRAEGVAAKIDPLLKELGSMKALIQEQDMRLSTFRVTFDMQEKRTQSLAERLEAIDMDGNLKRVQEHDTTDNAAFQPRALFEDPAAGSIHAASVQVHAEQWLHSQDEPTRSIGLLSSSGRATPADRRELAGLCDNSRTLDSEDGE